MGYLLVTNDDGPDSPALPPLVAALEALAPVRVVVPAGERSWIGKAISRWHEVQVRAEKRAGLELTSVAGSPADCVNLAVHSLFGDPPEMVVAGINLGLNTGLGFFLSSGTVGAAMEGAIAGVPALAFSVGRVGDDREWKSGASSPELVDAWSRAAELAADVVRAVRAAGFPAGVDLLSVNFPVGAGPETPRAVTQIARVGYAGLFRAEGEGRYVHDFAGARFDGLELDGTDVGVLGDGRVSITPARLAHAVPLAPTIKGALERSS